MSNRDSYELLAERLAAGSAAMATVVRTKGSTPREVGAKMIIQGDRIWGTIGGGCGEAEVLTVARTTLEQGRRSRQVVRVDLTEEILETSDRICGGIMDVLVEICGPDELTIQLPQTDLVRVVPLGAGEATLWTPSGTRSGSSAPNRDGGDPDRSRGPSIPAGDNGPNGTGDRARDLACEEVWSTQRSAVMSVPQETGEADCFFEVIARAPALIICGAGHVAQPLATMARLLDFRVVVIDDRPEFASRERFTDAHEVISRPFTEALAQLSIDRNTWAVLVTRGHRHDELCLRTLLETEISFVGMLGSRRRVRAVFDDLQSEGYSAAQLARVWAPVGLDIGAHTPAEIAVSILAEIVALQRDRCGDHPHLRRVPTQR